MICYKKINKDKSVIKTFVGLKLHIEKVSGF